MRISDWSSDVCSSDLLGADGDAGEFRPLGRGHVLRAGGLADLSGVVVAARRYHRAGAPEDAVDGCCCRIAPRGIVVDAGSLAQHLPRGATGRHAEPVGAVVPWRALPRKIGRATVRTPVTN